MNFSVGSFVEEKQTEKRGEEKRERREHRENEGKAKKKKKKKTKNISLFPFLPQRPARQDQPLVVQPREQHVDPLPDLAQHVLVRHEALVEDELAGV